MAALGKLLSRRRLLACVGVLALLFGLALLHPYPRQALFGPTIRGKPRCVWEAEIRRVVFDSYVYALRTQTLLRTTLSAIRHLKALVGAIGDYVGNMQGNQGLTQVEIS